MAKRRISKTRKLSRPVSAARGGKRQAAEAELATAIEAFQAGRLEAAQRAAAAVLDWQPANPVALHLLGVIARRAGDAATAADFLGRAVAAEPGYANAYNDLGGALFDLGRLEDAANAHERGLELLPDDVGQTMNLGNVYRALGRHDDALGQYQKALDLAPGLAGARVSIGMIKRAQGDAAGALKYLRPAAAAEPEMAVAQANLGKALLETGDAAAAEPVLARATGLAPDDAETWFFLGTARRSLDDKAGALAAFEAATAAAPGYARAWNNRGFVLDELDRLEDAVAAYESALAADPGFADAMVNLGNARREQGSLDDALALYERALAAAPGRADAASNAALVQHAVPGATPDAILQRHRTWEAAIGALLRGAWPDHANDRDPERRLKVGLVSADFGFHPVGYFTIGFVENHDARAFEITGYCGRPPDAMTERFMAVADNWVDTQAMTDADLAERIAADGIDVLFDLSGHTTNHRLLAFARKPAPVQISWSGYPGTTGLAAMDYLISDPRHTGPGDDAHHTEALIRMPASFICYAPRDDAPPVGPAPALENGHVTFGSFSNPSKINAPLLALWARVLEAVPDSRLLLIYKYLDAPSNRTRILDALAEAGIDAGRVTIEGKCPPERFLEGYNRIDIALDTAPYSGGATTCEALWMGVPVITLPGDSFASRHALSLLTAAGMAEFVAADEADYVAKAAALADDAAGLQTLRGALRARMAASPLCDAEAFTAALSTAIRDAWRAWCQG